MTIQMKLLLAVFCMVPSICQHCTKQNLGFFLESLYLALFKLDNMVSFLIARKVRDRFIFCLSGGKLNTNSFGKRLSPLRSVIGSSMRMTVV